MSDKRENGRDAQEERSSLSRFVHEEILGKCWHSNSKVTTGAKDCPDCGEPICGEGWQFRLRPDYTTDLNAVREAVLKAREVKGEKAVDDAFLEMIGEEIFRTGPVEWFLLNPIPICRALRRLYTENK